jgi:hypothetical protein
MLSNQFTENNMNIDYETSVSDTSNNSKIADISNIDMSTVEYTEDARYDTDLSDASSSCPIDITGNKDVLTEIVCDDKKDKNSDIVYDDTENDGLFERADNSRYKNYNSEWEKHIAKINEEHRIQELEHKKQKKIAYEEKIKNLSTVYDSIHDDNPINIESVPLDILEKLRTQFTALTLENSSDILCNWVTKDSLNKNNFSYSTMKDKQRKALIGHYTTKLDDLNKEL